MTKRNTNRLTSKRKLCWNSLALEPRSFKTLLNNVISATSNELLVTINATQPNTSTTLNLFTRATKHSAGFELHIFNDHALNSPLPSCCTAMAEGQRLKMNHNKHLVTSVTMVLILYLSVLTQQVQAGGHAMLVTAHPEATRVGIGILKRGGNAVDAAVAVQFTLAVVYPNAGNIGGGGFMLWRSKQGESLSLDFRERAPKLASRDMYLDAQGNVRELLSLEGALAAGVPGTVDGMVEAHRRLGTMSWKQLVQPAIDLARKGFRLTKKQAADLNDFRFALGRWNDSTCVLLNPNEWKVGDRLVQPALARTLEAIRDSGRAGFYAGQCADALVRCMRSRGGIISYEDLAEYRAIWRETLRGNYRGYEVHSMAPPSSGGIALLQLLSMWESHSSSLPSYHSAEQVHVMTECMRRVYADRAEWLGDPDAYRVPAKGLLNARYLQQRMIDFNKDSASLSSQIKAGAAEQYESEQTTHFSVVDKWGNAVALTTTLNASYGSKLMVPEAGFLLNNEMDDFSVKAGVPNMYGLVGSTRNSIAPSKRMLSSMTPTIISRNGKLVMVIGTPGGGTIMNSVFQCVINVLDYKMSMQQAVSESRFHHQWLPDALFVEDGCMELGVRDSLQKMGHNIRPRGPMGRVDAILVDKKGRLEGGADPRGDDTIASF